MAQFAVDRLCGESARNRGDELSVESTSVASPSPSFLFFFDQPNLTSLGRSNALSMARDLINRLVIGSARATIVSSAGKLKTLVIV
jgi:hypothetical protein